MIDFTWKGRLMRLLSLCLLLVLTACDDSGEFDETANRKVVTLTSEAGHEFHFMPIYEDGVSDITFRFAWPTNWSRDAENNPAVPYVGSDVILSGGTAELKPQDILAKFDDMNARGFLEATNDHVYGELEAPKEHIDEAITIASEMLSRPQLEARWIDRMKAGLTENQIEAKKVSGNLMWDAVRRKVLAGSPLVTHTSILEPETISALSADDIRQWHGKTFTKNDVTIAVTGAITPEDAGRLVDVILRDLPEGAPLPPLQDKADWSPRTILLHLPDAEKTTLAFLGRLPSTTEPDDHMDLVALQLLANPEGPLNTAIRTELRATYGFQAGFTNYTRALRPLFIVGEVEASQLAAARDAALSSYEEFRTSAQYTGFTDIKDRIVSGTKENLTYVNTSARAILELALDGKDVTLAPTFHSLFEDLSEGDIAVRLNEAFPPASELMTFAVGPDANALPGACVISAVEEAETCP